MINKNFLLKDNIKLKNFKTGLTNQLSRKFHKIFIDINNDIKNNKKTLNVLDNKFQLSFKFRELNKFKKFQTIAIIGMGGSILGAEAIYNFLKTKIKKKVYFFNDLNECKILKIKKKEVLSDVLFIIVSKSGSTLETLSNAFSLNIIKKNAKNLIIISEKKNNLLFNLSKKLNLFFVQHKNYIGGRYSVLSEVGVVPAYLMGLDIFQLRSKLLDFLKDKNKKLLRDSTIYLSEILNTKKKNNLIFLNYSPELDKALYWCQQLIAESLGKKDKGFLPIVSKAPKDHHSLLQLYLEGPKDKIFYIFSTGNKSKLKININKSVDKKNYLNKKFLGTIKNAQRNAMIKTLQKNKIPFREFKIKNLDEKTMGMFFSYFILETICIGKLSNINPFNQPAVEQVKKNTKKLLN